MSLKWSILNAHGTQSPLVFVDRVYTVYVSCSLEGIYNVTHFVGFKQHARGQTVLTGSNQTFSKSTENFLGSIDLYFKFSKFDSC